MRKSARRLRLRARPPRPLTPPARPPAAAERRPRAQHLERDVREAEHVLQRLDMEARSLAPDAARAARAKVADYRADLGKLRAAAAAAVAVAAPDAGRAELGLDADYLQAAAGQRERMLTATERLSRTGERIQQGRAQLLETEVSAGSGGFVGSGSWVVSAGFSALSVG